MDDDLQKIYIGRLSLNSTEQTIRESFCKYGNVINSVVMKDNKHKSRGFGFVTFDCIETVDIAMSDRPHKVDNKEVDTKRAVPRRLQGKPDAYITASKLFIGGITENISKSMLKEYFEQFGNVVLVDIKKDLLGRFRGFAFVLFDDHDPVDKALLYDSHSVDDCKIEIRKALNKNELVSVNGKIVSPMRSSDSRNIHNMMGQHFNSLPITNNDITTFSGFSNLNHEFTQMQNSQQQRFHQNTYIPSNEIMWNTHNSKKYLEI
ncbi:unnamed protein product [Gordionus sp. m RMFG-2023]